ncbi:unnamed protein product [Arctia plantaginis]|uniref:LRRNT domain-containing protein n=1 Tax=Arctia plantaginis TaxID=874455 RepID=A0A8S0Z0U4_ARCPL|nr:unnamed protein product [Arctia plantaginis]
MGRAVALVVGALVLAAALARAACPARTSDCACSDAGARVSCRGLGLRRLPPLHENLLSFTLDNLMCKINEPLLSESESVLLSIQAYVPSLTCSQAP